jgi:hypothetical protein
LHSIDKRSYIGKVYYYDANDQRDRLGTEFEALGFMWAKGMRNIPQPLIADRGGGLAIYEYVDGQAIDHESINKTDIDQAVVFLDSLWKLSSEPDAMQFRPASEACFTFSDIIKSIHRRLDILASIPRNGTHVPDLFYFLDEHFSPLFNQVKAWAYKYLENEKIDLDYELPHIERTLSPSDFGFHNAIRRRNGNIVFIDFEYFGWDDPAKMIVDFILHPGMRLLESQKLYFKGKAVDLFQQSKYLLCRLQVAHSLFGLKWCLILLNEFTPRALARRDFASLSGDDSASERLRKEQLRKAMAMLNKVKMNHSESYAGCN